MDTFSLTYSKYLKACKAVILIIGLLSFSSPLLAQTVFYVDQDATGADNGSSWANAFTNLQAAINQGTSVASPTTPAQIWVKADTYFPTSTTTQTIYFEIKNNVEMYGGFLGTEYLLSERDYRRNETILSGNIGSKSDSTDNTDRILVASSNIVNSATVDGFTITGSHASIGGALAMNGTAAKLTVNNCTFHGNYAELGSAISSFYVTNNSSILDVNNSTFYHNGASASNSSAVYTSNQLKVVNSVFYENKAFQGGAIIGFKGSVAILNSTFTKNSVSGGLGSVVGTQNVTSFSLVNSIVWNNSGGSYSALYGSGYPKTIASSLIDVDPLFSDPGNNNFQLKQCSPAVNIGNNSVVTLAQDISGNLRIYGTNVDAGAFENQTDPLLFGTIQTTNVSCNGADDGVIVASGGGGTGNVLFSIDGINFSADPTFENLAPGNYTITLKDQGDGCQITSSHTISGPSLITLNSLTSTNITCNSDADGKISVSVTGGSAPYQISFDGGISFESPQFTNSTEVDALSPGFYQVTIVDGNSCSVTHPTAIELTEPDVITSSVTVEDVLCNGVSSGVLHVTAAGGNAPLYYTLGGISGNYQSSPTFTGLTAGNYTVTVVDSKLCFKDIAATVSEPTVLSLSNINFDHLSCYESPDGGSFSFEAAGGVGPYEYSIDGTNFQANGLFANQAIGNYTITVRDANGCASTAPWEVTQPDELLANMTVTNTSLCSASDGAISIAATGGTQPYSYSIDGSPTQSSPIFNGLGAGSYLIGIKDANGCEAAYTVVVADPVSSVVTTSKTDVRCKGEATGSIEVMVTGGTAPIEYRLDGGSFQSTNVFDGLVSANYLITVKEANGCTQTLSVGISEPAAVLESSAISTNLSCFNSADGSISVTATGGTAPYQYSLDGTNFQTENVFSGLDAGDFIVTVKDINSCTVTKDITLLKPNEVTTTATVVSASCVGSMNGSITIDVTNGVAPLSFSLNDGIAQSSNVFDQLDPGTYSVTVSDASGCGPTITDIVVGANVVIEPITTVTNVACFGTANGTIAISAAGGAAPYEFSIDGTNFVTSSEFTGLAANTYSLTVKDANGCTATTQAVVAEPVALSAAAEATSPGCSSAADGSIAITAAGGTAPYTFSINGTDFQDSGSFVGLSANDYSLTAKDANGCTVDVAVTIAATEGFSVQSNISNLSCFGSADGSVSLSVTGSENATYTYSIDGENFQEAASFTGLAPGDYALTVKNVVGCTVQAAVAITSPAALSIILTEENGEVIATVEGGTAPYIFSSNGTDFQESNMFSLTPGSYTITAKDANGCVVGAEVVITIETGIADDLLKQGLIVYPNPAHNTIAFDAATLKTVRLYDLSGNEVLIVNNYRTQESIDLSHLVPGVVIVELELSTGERIKQRLIIER